MTFFIDLGKDHYEDHQTSIYRIQSDYTRYSFSINRNSQNKAFRKKYYFAANTKCYQRRSAITYLKWKCDCLITEWNIFFL